MKQKKSLESCREENSKAVSEIKERLDNHTKAMESQTKEYDEKIEILKGELSKMKSHLDSTSDQLLEKTDKVESLEWTKNDLETQIEKLKTLHREEVEETIDLVNDLKLKEDELETVHRDLNVQGRKLDELCKQLLSQEQKHKEALKRKDAEAEKKLEVADQKLTEAKNQCQFLKEQQGTSKVETDLQIEKLKLEHEGQIKLCNSEIEQKMNTVSKLKDDLSAREEELEFLKEELQAKTEEVEELSTDLDIKEASFSNENKEMEESHREEVEALITKNETLNTKIGELQEKIALQLSEFDAKTDEITRTKKTEVNDLKDQLNEKETTLLDQELRLKSLAAELTSLQSTLDGERGLALTKVDKLSTENESLRRSKYELETSVKNITCEREHIVSLNEDLSLRIVEFEVQVKEMGSQFQSLQVEYEKQQVELTEKQEIMSQGVTSLNDLEAALGGERTRVDTLQVSLNELEAERDQLAERLAALDEEAVGLRQAADENSALQASVADLTRKNEFLFEEIARERLRLESKITTLAEKCEAAAAEKTALKSALESVHEENVQLTSYKRQVLMLEQEKKELENQLVTLAVESRMQKRSTDTPSKTGAAVQQSKEVQLDGEEEGEEQLLRSQVDFLNSVIVDMQRKNDEMKSRLELMESAGILDESVEFYYAGVSARQRAPRLFCDICDVFDTHDTEDCPKQSSMVVEETGNTKHRAKRNQTPRPYCEACEVFGHETTDCNDNETF